MIESRKRTLNIRIIPCIVLIFSICLADANPLLKILYEAVGPFRDIEIERIQDSPHMWVFRTRITVDHLAQTLNENMSPAVRKNCAVLTHFIQQVWSV